MTITKISDDIIVSNALFLIRMYIIFLAFCKTKTWKKHNFGDSEGKALGVKIQNQAEQHRPTDV